MRRLLALASLILFAAALGGCGNKGPLYLPRPEQPASARTTASAPAPAPSASVPVQH